MYLMRSLHGEEKALNQPVYCSPYHNSAFSTTVQQRVTGPRGGLLSWLRVAGAEHKFPNMIEVKREQTK